MPYYHAGRSTHGTSDGRGGDAQLLHTAHHLVDLYLIHVRENETGNDLFDTRELPVEKERLINAFRVVIATESRPGVRALLVKAGMTLAQFQDDIGPRMSVKPVGLHDMNGAGHARPGPGQMRRFDHALMRLGEDRMRLAELFRGAADIAEHKPHHHA